MPKHPMKMMEETKNYNQIPLQLEPKEWIWPVDFRIRFTHSRFDAVKLITQKETTATLTVGSQDSCRQHITLFSQFVKLGE
jgi:hypothetical protein